MEVADGFQTSSIQKAVNLLRSGNIVAFPTETVYGLGADALNPYAVARIFEAKSRPHFDPLIVHISNKDWLSRYAREIPAVAKQLIDAFWPGPLTLILQKKNVIPDIVTAGLTTVGIRMPSHPVALRLIENFGSAIAAPSANPFGYMSPTKALHVQRTLKGRIPFVLDGGDSVVGLESTIVSFQETGIYIHRHGAITEENLSGFSGIIHNKPDGAIFNAPGELPYHYAPLKPLQIIHGPEDITDRNSSYLAYKKPKNDPPSRHMRILSEKGDIQEAAARFFSSLIDLDREDINIIYAEKVPETGIGKAIMDRLRKAAKKRTHGGYG